jgi:hypothetical protein
MVTCGTSGHHKARMNPVQSPPPTPAAVGLPAPGRPPTMPASATGHQGHHRPSVSVSSGAPPPCLRTSGRVAGQGIKGPGGPLPPGVHLCIGPSLPPIFQKAPEAERPPITLLLPSASKAIPAGWFCGLLHFCFGFFWEGVLIFWGFYKRGLR